MPNDPIAHLDFPIEYPIDPLLIGPRAAELIALADAEVPRNPLPEVPPDPTKENNDRRPQH